MAVLLSTLVWGVPAVRRVLSIAGTADGAPMGEDPLQRRVLAELASFTQWLEDNRAEGYIGEIGIPNDGDDRWIDLARKWFQSAEQAGLWVDAWSVGDWWGSDYDYCPFVGTGEGAPAPTARPAGRLLTEVARSASVPVGVNVSGGEFGAPGGGNQVTEFSNANPGTYGRDYKYADEATFRYLAAQGLDTVRLPFRWERIQPTLGDELNRAELDRLRAAVQRAHEAGLGAILDVHNFAAYHLDEGGRGVRRAIGSPQVGRADFVDLWRRLSDAFADDPAVVAYDLMNEPIDPASTNRTSAARLWEAVSQEALTAIRASGDRKLVMVPGYGWSHLGGWTEEHLKGWIVDPADNFRYTAHHYWRHDYGTSYDTEVTDAAEAGY
ncbi:glycoside hydrolase family 5 protein [Geodermatophilus sp. SYSU D00697]